MSGFVSYFYNDGKLPAHTKSCFYEYGILRIHGIIVKNALLFMHKAHNFPSSLLQSIRETVPDNAPTIGSNHDNCSAGLQKFGQASYTSSIFGKGPLLTILATNIKLTTLQSILSLTIYKNSLKPEILKLQNLEDCENWPNFLLYFIPGRRKSTRNKYARFLPFLNLTI